MGDTVIKVKGVSKKYCRTIKHTMLYGATDLSKSFLGINQNTNHLRNGEFWAVDNLSFELKRGECLGFIGPNGSGKSTLLKMLNGIFMPDRGNIEINGRVGALIEVGAGFHPMLTGRENIYVNGSILGLSKKKIDRKFDDIIDFAEIGEFIDAPVKHYSSGMHVRLGFAIAAQMEPDILLIDEVLAVGDVGFKAKCFNAISNILKHAAVIFVSHAMPQVARVCTDICVMNIGKSIFQERDVPKGIEHYYSQFKPQKGVITGNGRSTIHSVEFDSRGKKNVEKINYMDNLIIHFKIDVDPKISNFNVSISFLNAEQQVVIQSSSLFHKVFLHNTGKQMHVSVEFKEVNLNPSIYSLSISATDETRLEVLSAYHSVKDLQVIGEFIGFAPVQLIGNWEVE
jgi:lipopolysaccharide transport system ATP-binding protein